ncbi:MAG: rod shape-determining protein RodA [bacterium]|nr:rod shape-determining protein RodA [bacterium]
MARRVRPFRHFDGWLMLAVACLFLLGILAITSVNPPDATRQIVNLVPGALAALFLVLYGHDWLDGKPAWVIYAICLVMLVAVDVFGHSALGAQRWLQLGPLKIQPSEYAKLGLIVALSRALALQNIQDPRGLTRAMAVVAFPALLVFKQPDLGTSLVFGAITLGMLAWAGVSMAFLFRLVSPVLALILSFPFVLVNQPVVHRVVLWAVVLYLAGLGLWLWLDRRPAPLARLVTWFANLGASAAVPFAWAVLKEYQKNRIRTFIDPEADPLGAGYHVIQSKIAIGSGGLTGRGLFHGTQTQLHFIPEQHTDFIYSVVGEELGFLISLGMIAAYVTVLVRGLIIADRARDRFGSLLAVGIVTMLGFHMFVNLGMATGIMPVVGIPLPFMSYGGTALMTNLAAIGILQSISMRRQRGLY